MISRLFRHTSKKTSNLCFTGLCEGNPPRNCSPILQFDIWVIAWYHIYFTMINVEQKSYFELRENTPHLTKLKSSPPSAEHMWQWIRSALVQIMACCLFGTKPLSKPMLGYCQLDTSVKFESNHKTFHSWKSISRCHLRNGSHFVQGEMGQHVSYGMSVVSIFEKFEQTITSLHSIFRKHLFWHASV